MRATVRTIKFENQSFQESESQDTAADDNEPVQAARMVNMLTSDSEFVTESESEMSEVQQTARRVVPPARWSTNELIK